MTTATATTLAMMMTMTIRRNRRWLPLPFVFIVFAPRLAPPPSPLVVLVFRSGRDRSSTPAADILLYISGISFEFFRSLYDFIRFVALFCSAHSPCSCCVSLKKERKLIALDPQQEDRFGIALDPMEDQFGIHQQRHAEAHGKEHDQVV